MVLGPDLHLHPRLMYPHSSPPLSSSANTLLLRFHHPPQRHIKPQCFAPGSIPFSRCRTTTTNSSLVHRDSSSASNTDLDSDSCMAETSRVLQAASVLSQALSAGSIPHAFHGSLLIALLSNSAQCNEVLCIVEGGAVHPFGRVRQAIDGHPYLTVTNSPWTNRLFVTYNQPIPSVTIEILPAGEEGPRRLDENTTTRIRAVPFLTVSEFVRAKINAWALRGLEQDVQDIIWVLAHYWQSVDINRIPESDMDRFVSQYPNAAPAWAAIKDRFSS